MTNTSIAQFINRIFNKIYAIRKSMRFSWIQTIVSTSLEKRFIISTNSHLYKCFIIPTLELCFNLYK